MGMMALIAVTMIVKIMISRVMGSRTRLMTVIMLMGGMPMSRCAKDGLQHGNHQGCRHDRSNQVVSHEVAHRDIIGLGALWIKVNQILSTGRRLAG
ncbi:MAG: hypothetical protein ACI97A_001424 [Planctomycetota bacterium]|jgi:hypothetical protein